MSYDKKLIEGKLKRWDNYIRHYNLPDWEDIPDFGLYMEQVSTLIYQYLNYLPTEAYSEKDKDKNREKEKKKDKDKDELFLITPSTINNYVRTKIMPEPVKKRYYRIHIAYLIMICTLKQSLSIAMIKKLIPMGISEEEVKRRYNEFIERHHFEVGYFADQLRAVAGPLYLPAGSEELANATFTAKSTEDLIFSIALLSGFSKLLAQKLVMLDGKDLGSGESVDMRYPEESDDPES
ncbi:MAG: DUF1836 domain-containing protein [Lachnospiraceae bacterium]|nr:DUF1836 domain-containing protein [Lachnospiraceae bacterium]